MIEAMQTAESFSSTFSTSQGIPVNNYIVRKKLHYWSDDCWVYWTCSTGPAMANTGHCLAAKADAKESAFVRAHICSFLLRWSIILVCPTYLVCLVTVLTRDLVDDTLRLVWRNWILGALGCLWASYDVWSMFVSVVGITHSDKVWLHLWGVRVCGGL